MANKQKHPQEKKDRLMVNALLQGEPDDLNLVELARLKTRYRGFPGAEEIQRDLNLVLNKWGFVSEEELFTKTRQIHSTGQIYRRSRDGQTQQDWS